MVRLLDDNIRVLVEGRSRASWGAPVRQSDARRRLHLRAKWRNWRDYFEGVTERRAQAPRPHGAGALRQYARHAARISSDVEMTVAAGGAPGWLADYIAQNLAVDVSAKQEIRMS